MVKHFSPWWMAIALLALGCDLKPTATTPAEVNANPRPQKTAAPVKITAGAIRGQVVDNSGTGVGGAEVHAGNLKSLSANPIASQVAAEVDNGRTMTLMHDFGDGRGPQLAERRPRLTQTKVEPYVYLKPGEFFIERVPVGAVMVTANFLSATASPASAKVEKDKTTEGLKLVLPLGGAAPLPTPSPSASVAPSATVEWSGMTPETGLNVRVTSAGLTYTPSDATVKLGLKANAGGVRVTAYNLVYQWTAAGKAQQSTPERVPMVPLPLTPGATVDLDVVLGGAVLADIYKDKIDPVTGQATSVLGIVTADVKFLNDAGVPLTGKDGQPLSVAVPIRRL